MSTEKIFVSGVLILCMAIAGALAYAVPKVEEQRTQQIKACVAAGQTWGRFGECQR